VSDPGIVWLNAADLIALVRRVFRPTAKDKRIAVLVDIPVGKPDDDAWRRRRLMAADWVMLLQGAEQELGLKTELFVYPNVGANNADLPSLLIPASPAALAANDPYVVDDDVPAALNWILDTHSIVIALTELSATAPLKLLARSHPFRAATMAGFSSAMIPALRIDYGEVSRRVFRMKSLLDGASRAELRFEIENGESCALTLDLRHRTGHASDGILDANGVAGNLPSGEAYIVPYEGERPGDPSGSNGRLPVQFGDEIVIFEIENNRAVRVHGDGVAAREQAEWLAREPAYGNIAELGLGVLGDFGLSPAGEILLDEKLGLHVAFGRSDHFGGQVGAAQFSRPDAVVHIDRVYIESLQPRIAASLDLIDEAGVVTQVIRESRFVFSF
jgi:hypothetical protein